MFEKSGTVTAYAAPDGVSISKDFSVIAGGKEVDLYNAGLNYYKNSVSYGYFDFDGGPVNVSITVSSDFTSYKLVPNSNEIKSKRKDHTITFNIARPCNFTLVLDGNYQGKVLHVFAEASEKNIPDPNDPNVIYYGPGYYDLINEPPIMVASGKTLYIAGGAVIRGRVRIEGAENVTVRGHGVLMNDRKAYSDTYDSIALAIGNSKNVTIQDLIVNRNESSWTSSMHGCSFVNVIGYKAVSPKFASSDGFNIISSHDITFDKVFIHSNDDAVAIKGISKKGYNKSFNPSESVPVYNITYKNSQLWNDCNNAIGIGAETLAQYFQNILFENIDVLYSFDDPVTPDQMTDRSAINICALNGTRFKNIKFKNIRVEKAKRLINIDMTDNFYNGAIWGDWSWQGYMEGLEYDNITSYSDGTNEIRVSGWDPEHQIRNVSFRNIKVDGKYISKFNDPHFVINPYAYSLNLESPDGRLTLERGPIPEKKLDFNSSEDFSSEQADKGWSYKVWINGQGNADMIWSNEGSGRWKGPKSADSIWKEEEKIFIKPDGGRVMLVWKANMQGVINITGTIKKYDLSGGDGVDAGIWKNGTQIWPAAGKWQTIEYSDSEGVSHDITEFVNPGDTISFRLVEKNDSEHNTTIWTPIIKYK